MPRSKAKVASWVDVAALPLIRVGDHQLSPAQTESLLLALQKSTLEAPLPLVSALKQHADPASLDAFAWKLFEQWLSANAVPKEKWAFLALGPFGSDASALKLTPMLRKWPGESQHKRAVMGLEVLRTIGTDTALMQLNSIAQKLKFKALQNKAREMMNAIAQDRGIPTVELEDRIVPDLAPDERGSRPFDYGGRQFRFVLGPDLKPMVRLPDGKVKSDPPKPSGKDDPEKAPAAYEAW